jgi:hypothetical protein
LQHFCGKVLALPTGNPKVVRPHADATLEVNRGIGEHQDPERL